jgi:broad specificity phosphatase PhoE
MSTAILVKHSLPEIIPGIPANEWHLSLVGKERCVTLADKLDLYKPDILQSSPEIKALVTSHILSDRMGLSVQIDPALHEHIRTNEPFSTQEHFEECIQLLFSHPQELVYGEETADRAFERFSRAIITLEEQNRGRNLVVVTHGTVITLFTEYFSALKPFPLWKRLGLPSFVVFTNPGWELSEIVDQV